MDPGDFLVMFLAFTLAMCFLYSLTSSSKKRFLRGADLEGAYLEEANLKKADLEGANLQEAYLKKIKNITLEQICECKSIENIRGLNNKFLEKVKEKKPELVEWWKPGK